MLTPDVCTRTTVGECEVTVLIVAAARHCRYVDLIAIVFAGVLEIHAELERVIAPNLGQAIGSGVDGTGGVGGIGSTRQAVEIVVQADGGNLSCNILAAEQVGISDRRV